MNIAYIVSGIKRSVFFENTAIELAKNGYNVNYILICNESDDFETFLSNNDLNFKVIEVKSLVYYPLYLLKIYRILRKTNPKIVHTHLTTANITGLVAARLALIKNRLYTAHSGEISEMGWKQKIFQAITRINTTVVIAITDAAKKNLINNGYKSNKIQVINHGFDIQRFQNPDSLIVNELQLKYNPQKKYPVIGVISRCVEWKGIQYTVTAFKKLLKEYPDAFLMLFNYSDGEEYSEVINGQLRDLPINSYKKVLFENNVYDLYNLFDVFVHVPIDATSEAFGQVYVEALASGVPSVFTLSGIATDFIVNNQNALVANYKDSESIFDQVKLLLTDMDLRKKVILNGKKDVLKKFGMENYISNLIDVYEHI
jgi:glycosyltransferase involved in cell wall biosynthesis